MIRKTLAPVNTGNKSLDRLLQQLTETVNRMSSGLGNKLEKNVTFKDLVDQGLIAYENRVDSNNISLPRPEKPTGFSSYATNNFVTLVWNAPLHPAYTHTSIYRSQTDDFETADLIGNEQGNQFTDNDVTQEETYYYWIQHFRAGEYGPLSDTAGREVYVPNSVTQILDLISGHIKQSDLHENLSNSIGHLNDLWSVKLSVGDISAGIGVFDDGDQTAFAIDVQKFYVFDSGAPENALLPFVIDNGVTYKGNFSANSDTIQAGTGYTYLFVPPTGSNKTINPLLKMTPDSGISGLCIGVSDEYGIFIDHQGENGEAIRTHSISNDGGKFQSYNSKKAGVRGVNESGCQVVLGNNTGGIGDYTPSQIYTGSTFPEVIVGGLLGTRNGLWYGRKSGSSFYWFDLVNRVDKSQGDAIVND